MSNIDVRRFIITNNLFYQNLDFNINISNTPENSKYQTVNANTQPQQYQAPSQQQQNSQQNQQPQQIDFTNFLQHAHHPVIVFFTLIFKVCAIIFFLFLKIFGLSDALIFILVVIFGAFDFWFVKNVSGRILVGLRWWNEVKEDGSEVWIFESAQEKRATSIDTTIFWGSLYIAPIFWAIFLIIELIGFQLMWFLVCLISLILTFSNTLGYYKCSGEQQKKVSNFAADKAQQGIAKLINYGAGAFANYQGNANK